MVCVPVVWLCSIIPVVVNYICDLRLYGSVFLPSAFLFEKIDLLFAPALCRDNIRVSQQNCNEGNKRRAPCVRIFDGIPSGNRLMFIVPVNDFPVRPVRFVTALILSGCAYYILSYLHFIHEYVTSCLMIFFRIE